MAEQTPGQVIGPNSDGGQNSTEPPAASIPPVPQFPSELSASPQPEPQLPPSSPGSQPDLYEAPATLQNNVQTNNDGAITWTASEYIGHEKSAAWYMLLFLVAVIIAAAVYFITSKDIMSVIVVMIAAFIFGIYAARPPRTLQYGIDDYGISIGKKLYPYSDLKAFSVTGEGAFASITFMPMKRFMPPLSIYFDPQEEDKIVSALSLCLPIEEPRRDPIDRLMRKIRF